MQHNNHNRADKIRIRGEITPITTKRAYVSQSIGQSVQPHQLPRNSKKFRPKGGNKSFSRAGETKLHPVASMNVHKDGKGNCPEPKVATQMWKRWSVAQGKYIYASSYGGKGWVKA